jgi:hypothetical protein
MHTFEDFREIVLVDFEYHHGGLGDHSPPVPLCACALELRSGQRHRLWDAELRTPSPPWPQWAPAVEQLRQIRAVVDQLREPSFQVHRGRNWYAILPFKCESSRNATIGCIFQAPVWLRGLIQPPPGRGLAYLDFEQVEFLIAGALAGDAAVLEAYAGGDPYTPFGIEAGLMPPGGTKHSHPQGRAVAKTCMLALQLGAGVHTLARKSNVSLHRAEDLRNAHRRLFRRTWNGPICKSNEASGRDITTPSTAGDCL